MAGTATGISGARWSSEWRLAALLHQILGVRLTGGRRIAASRRASTLIPPQMSAGHGSDQVSAIPTGSGAVRFLDSLPDPEEPIKGWSCAGPAVVDVSVVGGVIGISGPSAVRAAVSALALGKRNVLIITAGCAAQLYGSGTVPVEARVVETLDDALGLVHAELSERVRRQESGGVDENVDRIWLFAQADAEPARLRALIGEAAAHQIFAIVSGPWPFGPSLTVEDDGRVSSASSDVEQLIGARLAVAGPASVHGGARLATSEETRGREWRAAQPASGQFSLTWKAPASSAQSGAGPIRQDRAPAQLDLKPRLQILGPAAIAVAGRVIPGLLERRFSWEIATHLACHPEGVGADSLIEDLWPSEPISCARKRFSDALYYLRKALREAAGGSDGKFVLLRMSRYWLDRSLLDTDLWNFEEAIRRGRDASNDVERLASFQRAMDLYRGDLIHVGDGAWVEPFRQDLRRKMIDALTETARLIERERSGAAITLLERAIELAPCHEDADRNIMRIYHRLRRPEGVRAAYGALEERLARFGEQPSRETRELMRSLTDDIRLTI